MTQQRSEFHSAVILCARLCITIQNLSIGVNVVSEGSPSLILRVLLISFGITILPKSSTRRTIPVAVPDICLRRRRSLASVDRGHSLRSLLPPQAALPSLPCCFHISFSFSAGAQSLPCAKGGGCPQGRRRDCLYLHITIPQSASLTAPFTQGGLFPCLQSFYKLRC